MKRWVVVVAVVGALLMTLTASVWADPTNVGGGFTTLTSSTQGPVIFPGKGIPQGGPFAPAAGANSVLDPTNVGGG